MISFKAGATSINFNNAFVSKTVDDIKTGKLTLRKVDGDPDLIDDVQLFCNTMRADIDSNDVELADHETRISDNETTLSDHETRIGDNETTLTDHETRIGTNETEIQAIEDSVDAPNGIAPLDNNGEVPLANLPQSVQDGLSPQGNWDAATNTPDLAAMTPPAGYYWIVSVAGSTDLNGITDWGVNDWAVYTVSGWAKMDFSNSVTSVNSQTGVVVLDKTNIGLTDVLDKEQLTDEDGSFNAYTEKATPVEDDIVLIENSETGYSKAKVKLTNLLGGGSGGGGSFVWELNGDISPLEEIKTGISVLSFDYQQDSEIWAFIQVPDSYGTDPIKLKGLAFNSAASSDNVLFRCETFLNRAGEAINYQAHTSTNTEKTLTVANQLETIAEIDLTDGSGQINAVQVLPNDFLAIRLYRDLTNETISSTAFASFFKFSASISFTA